MPIIDITCPVNWAHPLNNGLVARFQSLPRAPGWSGGATLRDLARGKRMAKDGVLNGGVTWSGGPFGQCLNFNGSSGYVEVSSFTLGSNIVSVMAWAKCPNFSANQMIVCKEPVNADWEMFLEAGLFILRGASNNQVQYDISGLSAGWHHFAAVHDATQVGHSGQLFVDGVLVASGFPDAIANSTHTLSIGRFNDFSGGYYLSGSLANVLIWNRNVSAAEIASIYYYQRQQYDPTLNWLRRRAYSFPPASGGPITWKLKPNAYTPGETWLVHP